MCLFEGVLCLLSHFPSPYEQFVSFCESLQVSMSLVSVSSWSCWSLISAISFCSVIECHWPNKNTTGSLPLPRCVAWWALPLAWLWRGRVQGAFPYCTHFQFQLTYRGGKHSKQKSQQKKHQHYKSWEIEHWFWFSSPYQIEQYTNYPKILKHTFKMAIETDSGF